MRFAVTTQLCLAADTPGTNYDVSFADAAGTFQAVAVVAFWIGRSADGAGRANLQRGYGWGTSSSNRGFVSAYATDGGGTAQNRCLAYTSGIIGTASETVFDGSIDLTTLGDGTFRITVDDQLPADLLVGFAVIGDCTAFSAIKITPTGSGAENYTITGFEEDAEDQCLLTFGTMPTADPDTTLGDTGLMFGVAAGGPTPVNYVMWDGSNDNASTMQTISRCRGDRCFNRSDTGITTVDTDGHVSAWITNGIEVTWDTYSGTADRDFFVLPLKGARFKAGEFASSTSTGALTAQTGLGGTPNGLIVCSAGRAEDTTVSDHARTSFGVLDDDANLFVQAEYDQDGVGDAAIYTALDADGSDGEIVKIVSVADGKYAGISAAFDSDGFTPTQADADTGTSFNWYLLVGTESSGDPVEATYALPIEVLQGVSASRVVPFESLGVGLSTTISQIESLQTVLAQSSLPTESQRAVENSSTCNIESLQTVVREALANLEALLRQVAEHELPLEALRSVTRSESALIESLGLVSASESAPIESLGGVSASGQLPLESLGGVAIVSVLPIESLAEGVEFVSATYALPIEALASVAAALDLPFEAAATVITTEATSIESLQGVGATTQAVIEALGGVSVSSELPIEAAAELRSLASLPLESLQSVQLTAGSPLEALAGVSGAVVVPLESLGGVAAIASLPIEATAEAFPVSVIYVIPIESLAAVISTTTANIETTGAFLIRVEPNRAISKLIDRKPLSRDVDRVAKSKILT